MQDIISRYLDRLQTELDMARERYTQANGDEGFHAVMAAHHIAGLQRLSTHALRAAVSEAHDAGLSWRDIAPHVQINVATLHRKWQGAGGLTVGHL